MVGTCGTPGPKSLVVPILHGGITNTFPSFPVQAMSGRCPSKHFEDPPGKSGLGGGVERAQTSDGRVVGFRRSGMDGTECGPVTGGEEGEVEWVKEGNP